MQTLLNPGIFDMSPGIILIVFSPISAPFVKAKLSLSRNKGMLADYLLNYFLDGFAGAVNGDVSVLLVKRAAPAENVLDGIAGAHCYAAGLCDGIYAISWFDPRTGQTEKAEIQVEVRGKSCIMPKKPAAGDWMLIAECIEKTEK